MPDQVQHREFGVRFSEAIDYLKGKLPEASMAWDDLAGPVHAKVFTVAGATSADLLRDMHEAVTQAIEDGRSLSWFRKNFNEIVQKHGWTFKGKPGWRSRVIYETNMRAAQSAGQWKKFEAAAATGLELFLKYVTAGDPKVRPQHRAWNGLTYPLQDPFWDTHYPPNGYGCRCDVISYTKRGMTRKDLTVSEPFKLKTRDVINKDGEITDRVPLGIDPGWDHNVGKSWITPELSLGRKLASLPPELRGAVTDKTISPAFQSALSDNWKAFQSRAQAAGEVSGESQVVGFLDSATMRGLSSRAPALKVESTAVAVFDAQVAPLTAAASDAAPAWSRALAADLPGSLANYRAVLWDAVDERVLVVPQGAGPAAGLIGVIQLRPNVRTPLGQAFSVVSLGSSSLTELNNAGRYQVLVGRIR